MKIQLDKSTERGQGEYGWLSTRYSFSFADWYKPNKMGFGALRVLNDDAIAPGNGFGSHGHRDMEIITIVTKGAVRHNDSMQNSYVVHEGDVQVMSAGTGVVHAEYNDSATDPLLLFQLWILPKHQAISPRYEQKTFDFHAIKNTTKELVGENSLMINQDATIFYGAFEKGSSYTYTLKNKEHGVYVFVIEGSVVIAENVLTRRDAIGVSEVESVAVDVEEDVQLLFIEVPMNA